MKKRLTSVLAVLLAGSLLADSGSASAFGSCTGSRPSASLPAAASFDEQAMVPAILWVRMAFSPATFKQTRATADFMLTASMIGVTDTSRLQSFWSADLIALFLITCTGVAVGNGYLAIAAAAHIKDEKGHYKKTTLALVAVVALIQLALALYTFGDFIPPIYLSMSQARPLGAPLYLWSLSGATALALYEIVWPKARRLNALQKTLQKLQAGLRRFGVSSENAEAIFPFRYRRGLRIILIAVLLVVAVLLAPPIATRLVNQIGKARIQPSPISAAFAHPPIFRIPLASAA